jgi:hypothetical protein
MFCISLLFIQESNPDACALNFEKDIVGWRTSSIRRENELPEVNKALTSSIYQEELTISQRF